MTTYSGYTETEAQINARWIRWMKKAEEAMKQAAQAEQTQEQQPNLAVVLQ